MDYVFLSPGKESGSWPRNLCVVFHHQHELEELFLADLMGESCPPNPRLGTIHKHNRH